MKSIILALALCVPASAQTWQSSGYSKAASDSRFVNTWAAGDTMTGPLTLSGSSLTVTGPAGQIAVRSTSNAYLYIDRGATNRGGNLTFQTAGANKWITGVSDSDIYGTGEEYFIAETGKEGTPFLAITKPDGAVSVNSGLFSVGTSTFVVSGGKVGIGTSSTSAQAHIVSAAATTAYNADDELVIEDGSGVASINLVSGTNGNGRIAFSDAANAAGFIQYGHASNIMSFRTATFTRMTIVGTNTGIGTSSPANNLHVMGTTGIAVSSAITAGLSMVFRGAETKANILLNDPVAAGEFFYCTDCTAVSMCVSTGTAVGAWTKFTDKAAVCD